MQATLTQPAQASPSSESFVERLSRQLLNKYVVVRFADADSILVEVGHAVLEVNQPQAPCADYERCAVYIRYLSEEVDGALVQTFGYLFELSWQAICDFVQQHPEYTFAPWLVMPVLVQNGYGPTS